MLTKLDGGVRVYFRGGVKLEAFPACTRPMNTQRFQLTLPGPAVTAEVCFDDVVRYMLRTGWAPGKETARWTRYTRGNDNSDLGKDATFQGAESILGMIRFLGEVEGRSAGEVLRDVAVPEAPTGPPRLTEEQIVTQLRKFVENYKKVVDAAMGRVPLVLFDADTMLEALSAFSEGELSGGVLGEEARRREKVVDALVHGGAAEIHVVGFELETMPVRAQMPPGSKT